MTDTGYSQELVAFFKALADPNRLKIIGLLAQQPYSVEQLAALLGVGESTISHHLARLAEVELVAARAEGYYSIYSLQTEALAAKARRLLSPGDLPRLADNVDLAAFDRKVLASFTEPEGRIKAFPVQQAKYMVLLRYVVKAFEPGRRYGEKQVNELLAHYHEDYARLRRDLVDFHYMAREGGGREYWLLEK
jgi:hypothetical protein